MKIDPRIVNLGTQIKAKEREIANLKGKVHSPMLEKMLNDQLTKMKEELASLTGPSFRGK